MRVFWSWAALALCLLIAPLSSPAPMPARSLKKSVTQVASLPAAAELFCGSIESNGHIRPWRNAPVVDGARISNIAALAALSDRRLIVYRARLSGRRFAGVHLSNLCFEDSDLSRTDWGGASARGVAVVGSNLSDAVMSGAGLQGAVFYDSQLDGADASGADLADARIEGGSFDGLALRRARLHRFHLFCGLIVGDRQCGAPQKRGVDARGADLTLAAFDIYSTEGWNFDRALVDRTVVQLYQVTSFDRVVAKGPVILESSGDEHRERVRLIPAEWRRLLANEWTHRPDFACTGVRSVAERAICRSDMLPALDRRLGRVYRDALATGTATVAAQRRWLVRRDSCAGKPEAGFAREFCLFDAYNARLDDLRESLPVRARFRPGEEQFFISSELAPPAAFQRTALYARVFPVLAATADTKLYVRAVARDRIRAGAAAYGSNGHSCSLGGPVLDFGRTSGHFGARHSKEWLSRTPSPVREELITFIGHEARIDGEHGGWMLGEYAGCGVRASFDEMTRIAIPAAQHRWMGRRARDLLAT